MLEVSPYSLSTGLPTVFVEKIFLEPSTDNAKNNKIDVRINFSLEKGKQKSPWYLDDKLKGRLKVFVCLVSDKSLAKEMYSKRRLRREILSSGRLQSLIKTYIGMERSIVPPFSALSEDSTQILNAKLAYATEGLRYSVKTSISYAPKYLTCILVPYLVNLQTDTPSGVAPDEGITMGNICMEGIFKNGKVSSNSYIFRLTEGTPGYGTAGQIWIGPVHFNREAGFMAGARHSKGAHPVLNVELVANKKILDLRCQKYFEGLLINGKKDNLPIPVPAETSNKTNYFSPLYISRNQNNTVNLITGFNMVKAVKNLTKFSYLYHTPDELKGAIKITAVKIYRKRILNAPEGNRLTSAPIFNRCIETDSVEVPVANFSNAKLQVLNYRIDNNMIHFIGADEEMKNIVDGKYQYGISIDFVDNTARKLTSALAALDLTLREYETYVQTAQNPNAYDSALGRFKKEYITKMYGTTTAWKDLVNKYIALILITFGTKPFIKYSITTWQRNLLNMTDPKTASIGSILEFRGFVLNLTNKLSSLVGTQPSTNINEPQSGEASVVSGRKAAPLITIKHDFDTPYDACDKTNRGLNYFSYADGSSTILNVSFANWSRRMRQEAVRFTSTDPQGETVSPNGYLAPLGITTPSQQISIAGEMDFDRSLSILNAKLNPYKEDYGLAPSAPTVVMAQKQELLGYKGVSITGLKQDLAGYINRPTQEMDLYDSGQIVGESSHFVHDEDHQDSASGSHMATWTGTQTLEDSVLDSDLASEILNDLSLNFMPLEVVSSAQIRTSYAGQKLAQQPEITQNINPFEFNMNYNAEVAVEFLGGYRKKNGDSSAITPRWASLDSVDISAIGAQNRFLFCRLRRLNTILEQENVYELPTYNEYFILGGPPSVSSMLPGGNPSSNINSYAKGLEEDMSSTSVNKGNQELPTAYLTSTEMLNLSAASMKKQTGGRVSQKGKKPVITRGRSPTRGGGY